jgi:hypothetical protein
MDSNLTRGSRVQDRIWGGTENGTVTGVDEDGSVTIQWDSAEFTEDQRTLDEVEPIDGTGDLTPRYGVLYEREAGTTAAPSTQDNDEDADGL